MLLLNYSIADLGENEKNQTLALALNAVFVPSTFAFNKNTRFKPSIQDAKDDLCIKLTAKSEIQGQMEILESAWNQKEILAHPVIFNVGNDFIVRIGPTAIESKRFLNALDQCFKIYEVYKIPFSPYTRSVWRFIRSALYKIQTEEAQAGKVATLQALFK